MASPCVIARLAGGLGNQLFMYAFAKALALRNGVPLRLDTHSGFARDHTYRRSYLLDHLIPAEAVATRWQTRAWPLIGRGLQSLERWRNARLPLQDRNYLRERSHDFDADIYRLRVTRPLIVDGYWQSPRYFDDLPWAELIHFPDALTRPLAVERDTIRASAAPVCLAVRRYEEIPRLKRPMHILDADYYHRAMARLEECIDTPHYFVFAQDMQWARENLRSRHALTFASEKDADAGAIQDLYLMSQCRHHILSNSTLHWWGAWLASIRPGSTQPGSPRPGLTQPGAAPDALVVAPAAGWAGRDTLPASWLTL